MSQNILKNTIEDLELLRSTVPLVHNITNYVVMNNTANALLAIGASPIMAHAIEEVEEMVTICSATVINIGTLSEPWIQSMEKAAKKAVSIGKPLVLDPVGAGASNLRNTAIRRILDSGNPSIIRGNASEILSTLSSSGKTKGVDATDSSESAVETGKSLSNVTGGVVVISGATDYILKGTNQSQISNGDALMTKVTGLGCTASALCGAFAAVQKDQFRAATSAMVVMGIAGEMAKTKTSSPGSFQVAFLDALYELNADTIKQKLNAK
ncbi:hydroxyethylthiazole kinase [Leptospira levettii]|uniref:Hydroxyethylthiazole kinase n=1 Tax=Leptospira levettii TaxID=2023178 RepID=A0ABY2MMP4_9LEPT|nr:hydroxyethylthiazole kinase [Leptospira levettii]PKA27386.1 hydroxyethylthiazole kinase [Leptospira sp. mixed culture ATI2-C-A1]TGL69550.1 hydroxyethylthiazole kinase [Leptospira levettii]TGM25767.1 hydroxyethylthiazole kinase [Leptospira levettii]TGM85999.1 hydroxyethylthiazole kinase [Leptospira levettii]TGM91693.1 hydroxyethylthiazole kinase [Leptospira levettii]